MHCGNTEVITAMYHSQPFMNGCDITVESLYLLATAFTLNTCLNKGYGAGARPRTTGAQLAIPGARSAIPGARSG